MQPEGQREHWKWGQELISKNWTCQQNEEKKDKDLSENFVDWSVAYILFAHPDIDVQSQRHTQTIAAGLVGM